MASRKQPENVEYFKYVGIMTTNDARYTREIVSRIAMSKAKSNKKKNFHQQIGLKFMKKLIKCYIWSIALCGAENWTLRKVDRVRNEEVLHRDSKCRGGANWIGYVLRRNAW